MNTIPLKRLMLRDFQGGTITVDADGENLNIYSANGSGKTRLMSALLWLLTGKDSMGRSDFAIKNLDAAGNQEHGLDHTVEAVFDVGGNDLTLKKIYHEVWTKKRGQAKAEMTGNTVDHFIDGVPVKENEYKARVSEIFGDETRFRLLTNPAAFALMPWQKQRVLLFDVCGKENVPTDDEILTSDESFAPLRSALAKYTVSKAPLDDLKKVTTSSQTEIKNKIDEIPIRISEARRGMPDVTGLDRGAVLKEVQDLEASLNAANLRLQGIDTGGRIAPLTKELNALAYEISGLETTHNLKQSDIVVNLNRKMRAITEDQETAIRKSKSIKADAEEKKQRLASLDTSLDRLRDKWNGIDGEEFQDTTAPVCPACGQNLPEDRVEAAREKAKAAFNLAKAERISYVQSEGKRMRTERDRIAREVEKLEADLLTLSPDESSSGNKAELERLTAERDAAKALAADYSGIIGRQDLLDRKVALEKAIADAKEATTGDQTPILAEIASLSIKLGEAKEKADRFTKRKYGEARVVELKAEEKMLSAEHERLAQLLYLIETFIKQKVALVTPVINSKFSIVSFKLFDIQVNGALSECCVFTVNGVPYDGGLNAAARTQGGLDIIRTLQEHYGIAPTVFIDNRESVSEIPEMDCQIVNLIVSPQDKVLRVETTSRQAATKKAA